MTSAILSSSTVRLFGHLISDLQIRAQDKADSLVIAVARRKSNFPLGGNAGASIDGVNLAANDLVLFTGQNVKEDNGVYEWVAANQPFDKTNLGRDRAVRVTGGSDENKGFYIFNPKSYKYRKVKEKQLNRFLERISGNKFVETILDSEDANLARIYGFSVDGQYTDMVRPTVFLVHGDGGDVFDNDPRASSPPDPGVSGIGAAEFQFAQQLKFWEYDAADFTVRMDIYTGMFNEILLDFEFDGEDVFDGGSAVGGGRVGGGRVGGGRVGGGRVGGGRVGGGRVGGGRVGGGRVGGGRVGGG